MFGYLNTGLHASSTAGLDTLITDETRIQSYWTSPEVKRK